MSLSKELADAVAKSFDVKPGVDRTKIDTMGSEMSEAIVKFITKQPFKVQELKAVVELDKLKNGGIDTNVKPSTLLGPYAPIFDFFKKLKPAFDLATGGAFGKAFGKVEGAVKAAAAVSSVRGAKTEDIDMKKDKGLETKGYAYIGGTEVDDENLGSVSTVTLSIDDVVDA